MYKDFTDSLEGFKKPIAILIPLIISVFIPLVAIIPAIQLWLVAKDLEEYLNKDTFKVQSSIETLVLDEKTLKNKVHSLQEQYKISTDIVSLKKDKDFLKGRVKDLREEKDILSSVSELLDEKNKIIAKIKELKAQILEEDDKILYQSFGIYKPRYSFENSDGYKERLKEVIKEQKKMAKEETAFEFISTYAMNGSEVKGKKMQTNFAKFGMTTFNLESTNAIKNVKFNNFEQMETRINTSFNKVNKGLANFDIELKEEYLELKIQELHLAYEYAKVKQEEKEYEQEVRRIQKEEELELKRIEKEIAAERKKLEKEQSHFEKARKEKLEQLKVTESEDDKQVLAEELEKLEEQIESVVTQNETLDEKLVVKNKAGYVYIISNIGAFGEDVYKIGVTRRANPEDRVKELSGASVPFKFDIHALIFSDDAFALETALHQEFSHKQVNLANNKKEFFHVSLDEIKDVVRKNYNKVVEFTDIPEAEEYRQSLLLLEEDKQTA